MSNLHFSTSVMNGRQLQPQVVQEQAKAKVNLCLHVEGKRQDGYHELESLVVFADVCDDVSFTPDRRDELTVAGPFAAAIDGENLIFKAKRAVSAWLEQEITGHFRLMKNIPVAAGLGGGSSDAAAVIRALLSAYAAERPHSPAFAASTARIGADVPVCLHHRAAWMRGVGEEITPVNHVCGLPALLVNPGVKLSTRDVFNALDAKPYDPDERGNLTPVWSWTCVDEAADCLAYGRNDLEPPAVALQPMIAEILALLKSTDGCVLSRLSGSGPTCFGLFRTMENARAAEEDLRQRFPRWWVAATSLS